MAALELLYGMMISLQQRLWFASALHQMKTLVVPAG